MTAGLPKRSKRYGVGKEIGGAVYVHRDYEGRLGDAVTEAMPKAIHGIARSLAIRKSTTTSGSSSPMTIRDSMSNRASKDRSLGRHSRELIESESGGRATGTSTLSRDSCRVRETHHREWRVAHNLFKIEAAEVGRFFAAPMRRIVA